MPNQQAPQLNNQNRRYYFDRNYLLQYIDQKVKLKVYVDGRFLSISDSSDLEDESHGVGYDTSGNPKFFDYRSILKLKAGAELLTLDQLQQQQAQPSSPEKPKQSNQKEPSSDEEDSIDSEEPPPPEDEEESPPTKTPQKAHYDPYDLGKNLIRENRKMQRPSDGRIVRIVSGHYANQSGIVISEISNSYEIRLLSGTLGRIYVDKEDIKFV